MRITEDMIDAVFDSLGVADMEVVYADHRESSGVVYGEAGNDAREPMADGLRNALALASGDKPGATDA